MKFNPNNRLPEANIQAEFYHQCKLNNIKCYLHYKIDHSVFDAIIIKDNTIIKIIEFKSYVTNRDGKINTKQLKKYSQYGIPIVLITRLWQIQNVIDSLK
jgi:hypothetical protein